MKNYSYELFEVESGKYGYKILVEGLPIIVQPHFPCVAGDVLMDREEAEEMAKLVVSKLQNERTPEEEEELTNLIAEAGGPERIMTLPKEKRDRINVLAWKGNPTVDLDEVIEVRKKVKDKNK